MFRMIRRNENAGWFGIAKWGVLHKGYHIYF